MYKGLRFIEKGIIKLVSLGIIMTNKTIILDMQLPTNHLGVDFYKTVKFNVI